MRSCKIKELQVIQNVLVMIAIILMTSMAYAQGTKENELSGSDLWAQNCGRCHNFRGPQEFNDSQWTIIVSHMRVIGGIPGAQARAIIKFLQGANNPPLEPVVSATPETVSEVREPELKIDVKLGNVEKGMGLYQKNCTSCHGMSGKGDGPAAVSMQPSPRNLTDKKYMSDLSDEYLYKVIAYGGTSVGKSALMPAWESVLNQDDIVDIIAYLRTLSQH